MSFATHPGVAASRARVRTRRLAAAGIVSGGAFLLGRTIVMMSSGSLRSATWWAAGLLVVEFAVDAVVVAAGLRLLASGRQRDATPAVRAVAAMIVVHALRVAVFVLGRTGPWVDFDVRPAYRADHAETWRWFDVWFAGTAATISVIALVVVWQQRRRQRVHPRDPSSGT